MEEKKIPHHTFYMADRKEIKMTGVTEVRSFDEQEIVLETEFGGLLLRGSGMHISRLMLEKGEADISGVLESMIYTQKKGNGRKNETLLARLFR